MSSVLSTKLFVSDPDARKVHYWESGDPSQIFLPTQIMLWTNALVDIIITIALTTHLTKLKRGFNEA